MDWDFSCHDTCDSVGVGQVIKIVEPNIRVSRDGKHQGGGGSR